MSRFSANGDQTWKQLHRHLSPVPSPGDPDPSDVPVSSAKPRPVTPELIRGRSKMPYAELHVHSNFSFLRAASHPEELVGEAVRLGLTGLALTDHDGLYGAVMFAEAAREAGLPAIYGAELSLGLPGDQAGVPDPVGEHLLVLARGQQGYHRLAGLIGDAHLAGEEKGRPVYPDVEVIAERLHGHAVVLTGCRKGAVPAALAAGGPDAARRQLSKLAALFGRDNVVVELSNHGHPLDLERNDALTDLAAQAGLRSVATNNVHYHVPARRRLATIMDAVRARSTLDGINPYLPAAATAHLMSGDEMAERMRWHPWAVPYAAELAGELAFDLRHVSPQLPPFAVPAGHTEATWLRELTMRGAAQRYGPPQAHPDAYAQIEHELQLIERLNFPGYFLIVADLVAFCRDRKILCQGRGSAANSAVCYSLWITNVDPVAHRLLFERFLAEQRDGPPDIDIDIESDRREEVIQYVYRTHGRRRTALVANVISYRPRSAVRDVAKALGFSPGQQDAWSKQIDSWSALEPADATALGIPAQVVQFATELIGAPRHLGIHPGGMVITAIDVIEVVPVEWARMEGRTVLQWDKDSCALAGLVKFDLLGLGMLSALHYAYDFLGAELDLGKLDCADPEVYDMLCLADTVGVFQVESRAQRSTLGRLKPRCFYDLVIEVALIRPGPIQGGAVHPLIARREGKEPVTYATPLLRNALEKTMGVFLFQEQVMQAAIDVGGFTAGESDQLRRAMGSKRSTEKMVRLQQRFIEGAVARGVTEDIAGQIFTKLEAFASYGFPESHSASFAFLVYASAWLKRYHPAAFTAALLAAQPMGFYSPQSLVDDARRHGVKVLRPCINTSLPKASLLSDADTRWGSGPGEPPSRWGLGGPVVLLGLDQVRTLSDEVAQRIVTTRDADGPFQDMSDAARRCGLSTAHLEALSTAGAFEVFGLDRRQALWAAGAAAQDTPDRLPHTIAGIEAPTLPGMDEADLLVADVWATGLSPDNHPMALVRAELDQQDVVPIAKLRALPTQSRVKVAGIVTHRQRPGTARGTTFISLEDETGDLNVICSPGAWERWKAIAKTSSALVIRGRVEQAGSVLNFIVETMAPIRTLGRTQSRDFR